MLVSFEVHHRNSAAHDLLISAIEGHNFIGGILIAHRALGDFFSVLQRYLVDFFCFEFGFNPIELQHFSGIVLALITSVELAQFWQLDA